MPGRSSTRLLARKSKSPLQPSGLDGQLAVQYGINVLPSIFLIDSRAKSSATR